MDPIDLAIAEALLHDNPNLSKMTDTHGVHRSTLSRRVNKVTVSKAQKDVNQQLLSPPQEASLVKYINKLTDIGLPPTPAMVNNFAAEIAQQQPGINWCSRFVKRWSNQLESRYLKPIDAVRKKVDSEREYRLYFELVTEKIEHYNVLTANIYNMDEKGFLLGYLTKAKRIFTKTAFESKRLLGNLQDGNREWITVVAAICADGTAIAPAVIYKAATGNLQDSWVQDLDPLKHMAFFASSPTGWTNDSLGFEWLTCVFDRETKSKARQGRDWRLLFVDGHGSHINMRFLDWCIQHRILVAVYPPHSTHRLQPLDVGMFSPLAIYYSQQLDAFLHASQGITSLTKRDFFRLFWNAYTQSFTETNIKSAWRKTGLQPLDPQQILGIFKTATEPRPVSSSSSSSTLSASDWRKIRGLLKEVVSEVTTEQDKHKVSKLQNTLLSITAENALLKVQNQGFIDALSNEKKRRKRGKALFEELRAADSQGATFFSPYKIQQAKDLQQLKEQAKLDKQREKDDQNQAKTAERQLLQESAAATRATRQKRAAEKREIIASKAATKERQKDHVSASQQLQQLLTTAAKEVPSLTSMAVNPERPHTQLPERPKEKEPNQLVTRSGRAPRKPHHLEGFQLDS